MRTTPEYTQLSLAQRLTRHARTAWPQLTDLHIRHRGQFATAAFDHACGWSLHGRLAARSARANSGEMVCSWMRAQSTR
jgi:hypothetical protein